MNIAIDARECTPNGAGKGRYVSELINSLKNIDHQNNYYLLVKSELSISLPSNFKKIKLPKYPYFWIRKNLKKINIDVFLSPTSYLMCLFSNVKTIIVVHDLAVFLEPKARPKLKTKLIEKLTLKLALVKAQKVVAVSANTKKDILNNFKIEAGKIEVILLAAMTKSANSSVDIFKKYNLPSKYILYVGTIEPRKNLDNLIKAYALMSDNLKENFHLVFVGKRGWNSDSIDSTISQTKTSQYIHEVGFIPDEELPLFYKNAYLFVYPSWYEGFGLPVLEAMNNSLPVITSNISSLPEVVGEGGILVSPSDIKQISHEIIKLLTNESLAHKYALAGKKQAEEFSWNKTASQMLELLKMVGKNK
jgi:glycosyltransferase involved in cell wall biosynthesis